MRSSGAFQPFAQLGRLLQARAAALPSAPRPAGGSASCAESHPLTDRDLFLQAMAGVRPLAPGRHTAARTRHPPSLPPNPILDGEDEVGRCLQDLVHHGWGFRVADTPEYAEGLGERAHPDLTRRLHRGDYAIQDHMDLHGLHLPEAREAFDRFMRQAITSGKRMVLIVHGRGLSSSGPPVLKAAVLDWLRQRPWRRWVLAFASARLCDGGAGATYVLLRARPLRQRTSRA